MDKLNLGKDHKITMFSALAAFILSMLIGFISGNPGAVVFVRALISALLFGAVILGGLYLLRRYIPELEKGPDEAVSVAHSDVGKKVDYSVSGEDRAGVPAGEMPVQEAMATAHTDTGNAVPGTEKASVPLSEGTRLRGETGGSEEVLQPVSGTPDGSSLNELEGITLEPFEENGNEIGEELPSLDELYKEHEQESVPDIDTSEIISADTSLAVGDYIEVGNARIPYEPEVLAKAVKKVMKEDE
jgi:hypothetical protein